MKSKHSVQLRMIRGPQEGARITLQPGSYKLGGFESGDILLCEDNLDEKPMVLDIAQGARGPVVRIRAADGVGASVGGRILEGDGAVVIKPRQIVQVGQTQFTLQPETDKWTPRPSLKAYPADSSSPQPVFSPGRALIAAGCAAALLGCGALLFRSPVVSRLAEPKPPSPEEAAAPQAPEQPLQWPAGVHVSSPGPESGGVYSVYARDSQGLALAKEFARQRLPRGKAVFYGVAGLQERASALVETKGLPLLVEVREDGSALLYGALPPNGLAEGDSPEKVAETLRRRISGLREIGVRTWQREDILRTLGEELADKPWARLLRFHFEGPWLMAAGVLSEGDETSWNGLREALAQRYGPFIRERLNSAYPGPDLRIATVYPGESDGHVTLRSGETLFAGGGFPNGARLLAVQERGLVVEWNGSLYLAQP
jgi:hypothetical protein